MILGIVFSVLLLITFLIVSLFTSLFVPTQELWNYVSCGIRMLMGIGAAGIFIWLYGKSRLKECYSMRKLGRGLFPSVPLLLFIMTNFVVLFMGFIEFRIPSVSDFICSVFLMHLTTSFFEETVFRGLFMGGYFLIKHQNRFTRLVFALLSSAFFAACHPQYYTDPIRLFCIFALGFSLASIYLYSRSLLTCTIIHFLYNLSISILRYVRNESSVFRTQLYLSHYYIFIAMFVIGLLFILLKKPYTKEISVEDNTPEAEQTELIAEALTE